MEAAPVTILHLNTHILDTVLDTRPDLRLVIECLVAKDVSMKLYMMNKMIGDTDLALAASRDKATQRRGRGKMSSSMDAINTGWKGLMRSYFWSELGSGAGALGGSGSGFNKKSPSSKSSSTVTKRPPTRSWLMAPERNHKNQHSCLFQ